MSNNNGNAILAWIDEVHALHAELSRPIEGTSDPRYVALVERFGETVTNEEFDAKQLGRDYWDFCVGHMVPVPPITRPGWAKSHTFYTDDFPHTLGIEFEGDRREGGSPEAWAQLTVSYLVALQDFADGDTGRRRGDVWGGRTDIAVGYGEPFGADGSPIDRIAYLSVDGARALRIALGDVLEGVPFEPVVTQ